MILNEFWSNLWNGVVSFFQDLGNFFLTQNEYGLSVLSRIIIAIVVMVLGVIIIKIIIAGLKRASGIKKGIAADMSAKSFFITTLKITLYIALAFIVVTILGINITGAVGILSAVTVALGLALQDIIGMFASGILIFNARNFKTGDYIKVVNSFGQEEGKVYKISLLYTILLNFNGQKIFIPNNNITKANVTNFTDHENRRGLIEISLSYDCDSKEVISTLTEAANSVEKILKDPSPSVIINQFTSYGAEYQVRFYSSLDDYWDNLFKLRELILEKVKEKGYKIALATNLSIKEN